MHKKLLIGLMLVCTYYSSLATGQRSELIIYEQDTLELLSLPLKDYLSGNNNNGERYALPTFCSTDLWRAYQALWKLEKGTLFLVDVYACGDRSRSIFNTIFDAKSPVKADWFSGSLAIQKGELIEYFHSGFDRYYEKEILVEIDAGTQVSKREFTNGYSVNDHNLSPNPDSVRLEVYRRIQWKELPASEEEYSVYVMVKTGQIDSLKIIIKKAPAIYVEEVQRVLDNFPPLRTFYARGEPLRKQFAFPVLFNKKEGE